MSGREWKPGDVAMVTRDGKDVVAMRYDTGAERGWRYQAAVGSAFDHFDPDSGTNPRPLVVIDPESSQQVWDFASVLFGRHFDWKQPAQCHYEDVRVALRSLVTPPKPEEPTGLGAVVEDVDGNVWVRISRIGYGDWREVNDETARCEHFRDIAAVKVLSDGVTP